MSKAVSKKKSILGRHVTAACRSYPLSRECMNRCGSHAKYCDSCYWDWLKAGKPE